MDRPTQEQIKEFWEWCGFKNKEWLNNPKHFYWETPFGNLFGELVPPIDLNNLFKYAEQPLVDHFIDTTSTEEEYRKAYYDFLCTWLRNYIWKEPHDPALALFWAIYSIIDKTTPYDNRAAPETLDSLMGIDSSKDLFPYSPEG